MFLKEIYDLYQGLMIASVDIDKIFQIPLRLIKAKQVRYYQLNIIKNVNIRSENIHKEEFTNMIKNDGFISIFFKCFKHANQEEYRPLKEKIFIIENELMNSPKDLEKLREFVYDCENSTINPSISPIKPSTNSTANLLINTNNTNNTSTNSINNNININFPQR